MTGDAQSELSRFPAIHWPTEHLRMTVFSDSERPFENARGWWESIVGSQPSNVNEEPQSGTVQLQKEDGRSILHMYADGARMDFRQLFLLPNSQQEVGPPFLEATKPFVQLVKSWLGKRPLNKIQRMAFGSSVLRRCSRIEDCRDVLSAYVPLLDEPSSDLRDFLHQTNRWRASRVVTGLDINRLVKWSVRRVNRVSIDASTGKGSGLTTEFDPRLEVDINSFPEHADLLKPHRLELLFGEFVDLAELFHAKGE